MTSTSTCWPSPPTPTRTTLLDVLDAAAAVALVRDRRTRPGSFSFAHALIQHTLYEDLGATRRARAHRAVAEALEELCGDEPGARVGELARHWCNATQPIDLTRAISYAQRAGDPLVHCPPTRRSATTARHSSSTTGSTTSMRRRSWT